MIKKLLISFIVILIIAGALGLYGAFKYRAALREQRTTTKAKAPQSTITFVEGWNNNQIADYLEKNNIVKADDFLSAVANFDASDYALVSQKPKNADLQGFIFPDTYFIPQTAPSSTTLSDIIIKKALDNFELKFTPDMQAQAEADNMSVYQILTLASIVEKESGPSQSDRQTIAGIFYNRLKAGMPLQSDATISFITGKPDVSDSDTQIDNPYNTFKYPGLPIGPICNPGLNSIMAALYPTSSDYVYFLTNPQTGQAIFAKTYQEQLQNKVKYLP